MFSTLNQFLNLKKDVALPDDGTRLSKYEIIAKLYYLINKLSEEQKLNLLKELLQDRGSEYLFKLIIDLPENQRLALMRQLEEITLRSTHYERRKYPRKDCLINTRISVEGRINSGFILDINPFGAFIDTSDGILAGQSVKLMFSLPNNHERLLLSGEIIWSETQGAGLRFNHLPTQQLEIIRSFTKTKQTVYEITS